MTTLRQPPGYRLQPATDEDIRWIARLQQGAYSAADAIPESILRGWYDANPRGFWVIWSHDGRRVGHVDILPLRPAVRDRFVAGEMLERDIPPAMLFGPHDQGLVSCLYVESVVIAVPSPGTNAAALFATLEAFPRMVDTIGSRHRIETVYGIAASEAGSQLMRHMGMSLLGTRRKRLDLHDLYTAPAEIVMARAAALRRSS